MVFHDMHAEKITAQLDHLAIHVRNLQASTQFYQSVLGLQIIPDPFQDGQHIWLHVGVHQQLHLISGAQKTTGEDMQVHMAFRVRSVDEFVRRLRDLHVTFVNLKGEAGQIATRPDGIKQVYLQDPDGYWIEVNQAEY